MCERSNIPYYYQIIQLPSFQLTWWAPVLILPCTYNDLFEYSITKGRNARQYRPESFREKCFCRKVVRDSYQSYVTPPTGIIQLFQSSDNLSILERKSFATLTKMLVPYLWPKHFSP